MDREHHGQLGAAWVYQLAAMACSKHLLPEWGFCLAFSRILVTRYKVQATTTSK
jgi:hypothetical protein